MRTIPIALIALLQAVATAPARAAVDFAHQIVPLLKAKCAECHTGLKRKGGLSIDTRQKLLQGGENGPALAPGDSAGSLLIKLITTADADDRMPPKGDPLAADQVALLKQWIDQGAGWEPGFSFSPQRRAAPLAPRRVELPAAASDSGENPIDRLLIDYYRKNNVPASVAAAEDRAFIRRASLDLIGLLPEPPKVQAFVADSSPDKRDKLVRSLLADNRNYAEHWISFWNDALRNAYKGTGFIDGGRWQITGWLYQSLYSNKPYNRFVADLLSGAAGAEGFAKGIVWRGVVNASQRPEMQAAQNFSQVFMGINIKCASCHDSFTADWKITDSHALASVFAERPLEIHRCDKPTGQISSVGFYYPELGRIDAAAPRPQRMKQLAAIVTKPDNGRLTRTIVNRLWAALMGRGLVEPVDDMDLAPWSEDLLDWLAWDLAEHGYDLKRTIQLICTSRAYSRPSIGMEDPKNKGFIFRGPVVKRMSAEQFVDSVADVTGVHYKASAGMLVLDGRAQAGQLMAIAPSIGIPMRTRQVNDANAAQKTAAKPVPKKTQTYVDGDDFGKIRASLVDADPLMLALGRPLREQVVTRRDSLATTLQALELTNGSTLDAILKTGARNLLAQGGNPIQRLYQTALCRPPAAAETAAAAELAGNPATAEGVADVLWTVLMLPEFQLIH